MTATGELSWPPAGSFLAAHGEVQMAADIAARNAVRRRSGMAAHVPAPFQ